MNSFNGLLQNIPFSGAPQEAGCEKMTNPYQNQEAIENPDDFFGRKKEIKIIFTLISDVAEPHNISIVGEKRIGKSSLLLFLKNEATRKKYLKKFDDYIFAYIELSDFLDDDNEKFCEMLLKELLSATSEEIPFPCNNIYEKLEQLIRLLSSEGKKIIIMFDEFDSVQGMPAFKSELLDYFRSLSSEYPLSFITSSRASIQELTESEDTSPFFNIFYNINLGYLEKREALELIEKPSSKQKVRFNEEDKNFINEIAFLHPFFIQVACYHLFNFRKDVSKPNGEKLDTYAYDSLFQRFYEETMDCWGYYLDHLNQVEKEALLKICGGEKISSEKQEAIHRLRSKGLIYDKDGRWRVFSSVFAYHIKK
ncbi:MAG: ATP-binding protein [Theionarchaea archaeon]|nr:ATP-binding protein [Theionarchaea archaeon]